MSSAVQRDETQDSFQLTATEGRGALRHLAAERLAAHRSRRAVVEGRELQAKREQALAQAAIRLQAHRDGVRAEVHPDASRVRDAVAARYQQSVSYREFLAIQAQRALEQAQAEAEVAERSARAVVAAQRQLLEEIEQWNQPESTSCDDTLASFDEMPLLEIVEPLAQAEAQHVWSRAREEAATSTPATPSPARYQVRLHEEMERASTASTFYAPAKRAPVAAEELAELDEEIEFRRAPEFGELVLGTQQIPANIIEFPRQLVASRKARPRIAEGPLREDGTPEPQLRIFEVEAEQISFEPELAATDAAPDWQGLLLGDAAAAQARVSMSPQLEQQLQLDHQMYAATVTRRLFSVAIDTLCIAAGLGGFSAVVVKIAGETLRGMPLPLLGGAAAGALAVLVLLYQLLFFTLNEATPGMRAARIAFCTFNEKSPTRKAMRRRLISTALAACPLGLGLAWAALDSDRLGWHDRMSHMYPRSY